jgi:hypothetical protein
MKTALKVLTLAVTALTIAASTTALADDPKPQHDACPFTDLLEMGVNQRYKVTFVNDCREMRYAIFAKVQSRPGICLSPGDRISFGPRHGIPSDCVVSTVEQLPPASGQTPVSEPSH